MSFVFQDLSIINNFELRRRWPFAGWFHSARHHDRVFPKDRQLIWLTYWFDFQIHGQDADGWRLTSLSMHMVNASLLALVSPVAAVLFFLHPLTLMGSSYVAGRSGLMSGMVQILVGILALSGYWVPAVAIALVAVRWLKQDSLIFFPMIGVLLWIR